MRIDKFLKYYNSLEGNATEIEKGVWANSRPMPYPYILFSKGWWKRLGRKIKDIKRIMKDEDAIVVTWK